MPLLHNSRSSFTPDATPSTIMLDRRFIVENPELVKQNCANRNVTVDVDRFVQLEQQRKATQSEIDELNRKANEVSKSIGKAKDAAEREARKEEGRQLRERVTAARAELSATQEQEAIHRSIPNMTHPDAPVGVDDTANREVSKGKTPVPQLDFQPLDHVELGEKLWSVRLRGGSPRDGARILLPQNEAVL